MAKRAAAAKAEPTEHLKVHDVYKVKLGELPPDEGNPREISETDFENLIGSLERFGFVEPFVARAEDGRIIGGHQRRGAILEFLARKGVKEKDALKQVVTVVKVPDLSESECRALNLGLNRIHGDWNYLVLPDYIAQITASDLPATGFSQDELDDIVQLTTAPPPDLGGDPDGYLSDMKLAFTFKVSSQQEADLCRAVLASYGMTGPKDAAMAFVRAMQAAEKK